MMHQPRVLIVDDNKLTCWGLEKVCSGNKFLVTTVNNGQEAISEINSTPFSLVFLDINLPDINGLEVLHEIKKVSPQTKVVIMTADNADDNKKKALEEGAFHFIGKPFSIPEITEVIHGINTPETL
jgi:two-component system, NtrC family, response regulator HydG